jgi:hypothetical protein
VNHGKFTLRRVHLDSGGYGPFGRYYGQGAPLYWYAGDDIDGMLRAHSREDAKDRVRKLFPSATFYR